MFVHLERHCAEAFKREVDQDENVFRSMPFFATALGLEIAIVGQIAVRLPSLTAEPYSIILHVLMGLTILALFATIIFLYFATAPRTFLYPPNEPDLVDWAIRERKAYLDQGFKRDEVEQVLDEEIRERLARQLATAASANRQQNLLRLKQRARAVFSTLISLLLAGAMGITIYTKHAFSASEFENACAPSSVASQAREVACP